jgi:sialate O-acetylesterase
MGTANWPDPSLDDQSWESAVQPGAWEDSGMPTFDGLVWLRRYFDLSAAWAPADAILHLGTIDDSDTTWINGTKVGATDGYTVQRRYPIPAALLKPGRNLIAIRVLDTGGRGGLTSHPGDLRLEISGPEPHEIDLGGEWRRKISVALNEVRDPLPAYYVESPHAPTVLFNAMIAPLIPYTIRGVIWYQGESNSSKSDKYQPLFTALIADWRQRWHQGTFPFLFVQIAPHRDMSPELREAQLLTLGSAPNTAMAVTIDCGDADDIHPTNKEPVGVRLALAARALAYGEKLEYSGPIYRRASFHGGRVIVEFTHDDGLMTKAGSLVGFTLAGNDGVFHAAEATIEHNTVIVTAAAVEQATAVRYAWANVPDGNLYNKAGLPASPFRSDMPKDKN